jgi:hypothetical protein
MKSAFIPLHSDAKLKNANTSVTKENSPFCHYTLLPTSSHPNTAYPLLLTSSHNKHQKSAPSFPKTLATALIKRKQIKARKPTYHASCHSHPINWLKCKHVLGITNTGIQAAY